MLFTSQVDCLICLWDLVVISDVPADEVLSTLSVVLSYVLPGIGMGDMLYPTLIVFTPRSVSRESW